jgi:hypothetical protein
MRDSASERWNLWRAFLVGAVPGALWGALWSWIDYGDFALGYMSNHVLGGLFMCGAAFLAVASSLNWRKRNPL